MASPAFADRAFALLLAGRRAEAAAVVERIAEDTRSLSSENSVAPLPLLAVELELRERYCDVVERAARNTRWTEAGLAAVDGELVRASELLEQIGARFEAAWAGLLAAERGDSSRLAAARAYFAEQGAVPFLTRCDALLSASA